MFTEDRGTKGRFFHGHMLCIMSYIVLACSLSENFSAWMIDVSNDAVLCVCVCVCMCVCVGGVCVCTCACVPGVLVNMDVCRSGE